MTKEATKVFASLFVFSLGLSTGKEGLSEWNRVSQQDNNDSILNPNPLWLIIIIIIGIILGCNVHMVVTIPI
jgi:hypothetical protein